MSVQNSDAKGVEQVDAGVFRNGMSKVVAAVHIITVGHGDDIMGTTATAVCSVSDSPPTLLVCLHRQGRVCNAIQVGTELAVNTLAHDQDKLAGIFAGVGTLSMPERFSHGRWDHSGGAPVLRDSVVCFQTRVDRVVEACSHNIVLCRVQNVIESHAEPATASSALLYGARNYRSLALEFN